jgi:NitT/TauT family transport system ATP-binding protein
VSVPDPFSTNVQEPSAQGSFAGGLSIVLAGLQRSFPGTTRGSTIDAVGPIDLTIDPGTVVVLIGPSGCGKTTVLRSIAGMLEPTQGEIRVGGMSPTAAKQRKQFGFVPQTPTLLPWRSVRENVELLLEVNTRKPTNPATNSASNSANNTPDNSANNTPSNRPNDSATNALEAATSHPMNANEIDSLLSDVGLAEFVDAKPHQLSGGMQQRVALVRAFALNAPILLLDEPFAALDEFTRADMRRLLMRLWQRTKPTVVFTTHSLDEAVLLADRVIVMAPRPGHVVADIPVAFARPVSIELEDSIAFYDKVREVRAALRNAFTAEGSQ